MNWRALKSTKIREILTSLFVGDYNTLNMLIRSEQHSNLKG